MDVWSSALISLILVATSIGLMVWHHRSWNEFRSQEIEPRERRFRANQHRRRMQTSAMLGILGVAIITGQLMMPRIRSGLFTAIYWGCVLLLIAWISLLALADMWATRNHFTRLKTDYLMERAKLQAEARRIKAAPTNGKGHEGAWPPN